MSEMKQQRRDVTYNYGEILSPYQHAGQNWDRPIGYWRALAYKWRAICLSILLLNSVLAISFFAELLGPQHQIWFAQVNANGFIEKGGWLNLNTPVPNSVTIKFIKSYMISVYGKSPQEQAFAKTYSANKLWGQMADLSDGNDGVQIDSIKQVGGDQYMIDWHVMRSQDTKSAQQAMLTLKRTALADDNMVHNNPFAYMVTQFQLIGSASHGR